jgi:hypothetical protein
MQPLMRVKGQRLPPFRFVLQTASTPELLHCAVFDIGKRILADIDTNFLGLNLR